MAVALLWAQQCLAVPSRSATGKAVRDWKITNNKPFMIAQYRNEGVGIEPLTVVWTLLEYHKDLR